MVGLIIIFIIVVIIILVILIGKRSSGSPGSSIPASAPLLPDHCPPPSAMGPWVSFKGTGNNDGYCCGGGGVVDSSGNCSIPGLVCAQDNNSNPGAFARCGDVNASICQSKATTYGINVGGFCCLGDVDDTFTECDGTIWCAWAVNENPQGYIPC